VQGPEHPQTLAAMNNLSNICLSTGHSEKARELREQVVAVQLRDQPNHPHTFVAMSSLAGLYWGPGQFDRAIDLWRSAMEGSVRILGVSHPATQDRISTFFAAARGSRKHLERARPVLEQGLEWSRRELGPRSKGTISATDSLANLLVLLGRPDEAIALINGLPADHEELGRPELASRTRLALALREHGRFDRARHLLEQIQAEALRLREKAPRPDEFIEGVRGTAQFLLARWPGLAPGVSPRERPPASFTIEAPFRATGPVADGRIAPGEYGPDVEATFEGDTNPGRLWAWGKSRSKTPDDLSFRLYTSYTDRSLFLAFRVRDQFVDASELDARAAENNDGVQVFIDGDREVNDHAPVFLIDSVGNREGFSLLADAAGHRTASPTDLTNAEWKVGTSRTSDGYIIEFEIPLTLIDTRDGPGSVPAASGSELRVNFGIIDNDTSVSDETDYGIFWAEDPALSPYFGGEDFWTVNLRLVPKPVGP
jgi:hypothetical protein